MAQLYSYPWYFAVYITLSRIRLTANLAARVCVCVATGRRVTKDSSFGPVAIFAAIDQGHHPPLRSLSDLPLEARRYAALDAWCTLRAWEGWQEQFHAAGEGSKDSGGQSGVAVTGCEAQSKKQAKKAAAIAWMSAADGLAAKPV